MTRIVFRTGQLASLLAVLHRYAATFYQIGEILSGLSMVSRGQVASRSLEPGAHRLTLDNIRKIRNLSGQVGLALSVKHADRILTNHETALTYGELRETVTQLQDRIRDELDTVYFLHVPFEKARIYYNPHPFGEAVDKQISQSDHRHAGGI